MRHFKGTAYVDNPHLELPTSGVMSENFDVVRNSLLEDGPPHMKYCEPIGPVNFVL